MAVEEGVPCPDAERGCGSGTGIVLERDAGAGVRGYLHVIVAGEGDARFHIDEGLSRQSLQGHKHDEYQNR